MIAHKSGGANSGSQNRWIASRRSKSTRAFSHEVRTNRADRCERPAYRSEECQNDLDVSSLGGLLLQHRGNKERLLLMDYHQDDSRPSGGQPANAPTDLGPGPVPLDSTLTSRDWWFSVDGVRRIEPRQISSKGRISLRPDSFRQQRDR
jgi:hypothetical protein